MEFTHEFRLSSPLEITDAAKEPLPAHVNSTDVRNRPAMAWSGNVTYSEAITLAENGWTDAPKLGVMAERITSQATRPSHDMQHSVSGACVDMGRFVEGHPECMLEFADEPAPKVISIAIQTGKLSNVTPRAMELAGAVALAVIDTLSTSGMLVDVIATSANRNSQSTAAALLTFPLKRAHEPLDENQLAFWLCHPAALRFLVFGWRDIAYSKDLYKRTGQDVNRGYSYAPKAADLGVDYVLECSPDTEDAALAEYTRIIEEITATL